MEITPTFGQWLRQRRHELDLTQEEVANGTGCSSDTIRKLESGKRRPSRQVAELLANVLNVGPEERPAFIQWARGTASPSRTITFTTGDFRVAPVDTGRSSSSVKPEISVPTLP